MSAGIRHHRVRTALVVSAFVAGAWALAAPAVRASVEPPAAHLDPDIAPALADAGGAPVRVILVLDEPAPRAAALHAGRKLSDLGRTPVARSLEPLIGELQANGEVARVRRHRLVAAISLEASATAVDAFAQRPGVKAVLLDRRQRLLEESDTELGTGRTPVAASTPAGGHLPAALIPWGISTIKADQVWGQLGFNGAGILVAHLDTGVDYNHPDLVSRMWQNPDEIAANAVDDDGNGYTDDVRGWDFSLSNANPMDDSGHGTHTAGTVVGVGTLGTATGVAPGATLMPLKVLASGYGYESDAWAAIDYAVSEGADIITMSLGWIQCYHQPHRDIWRAVAESADAAGVLIVAASGNEGDDWGMPWYCAPPMNVRAPADVPCVLAVGATNAAGSVPSFSGVGPVSWSSVTGYGDYPVPPGLRKPDVAAPGVSVISTLPGSRYSPATWSGTSMACPHVAGAAALMLDANPSLTPLQVRQKLAASAIDASAPGPDNYSGAGRIDAYGAVLAALGVSGTDVLDDPARPDTPRPEPVTMLHPAAPNPIRDGAELHFEMAASGSMSLEIFDAAGRLVTRVAEGSKNAGGHAAHWDARRANGEQLPSGIYWARFIAGGRQHVQKLVLAR